MVQTLVRLSHSIPLFPNISIGTNVSQIHVVLILSIGRCVNFNMAFVVKNRVGNRCMVTITYIGV